MRPPFPENQEAVSRRRFIADGTKLVLLFGTTTVVLTACGGGNDASKAKGSSSSAGPTLPPTTSTTLPSTSEAPAATSTTKPGGIDPSSTFGAWSCVSGDDGHAAWTVTIGQGTYSYFQSFSKADIIEPPDSGTWSYDFDTRTIVANSNAQHWRISVLEDKVIVHNPEFFTDGEREYFFSFNGTTAVFAGTAEALDARAPSSVEKMICARPDASGGE